MDGKNFETFDNDIPQAIVLHDACTATRMLEKRRQLMEVEEALEFQKDEFARKVDAFRRREDALRKKDLLLQDSLIKFNKFLQENEHKRTRAIKRCEDEAKNCELKDKKIAKLQGILKEKNEEEKNLSSELQKSIKYQNYLASVVDYVQCTSADFREIQDILDRYRILKNANDDLVQRQERHEKDHESEKEGYINFIKDSNNKMLNKNNEMACLQKELELVTHGSSLKDNLHGQSRCVASDQSSDVSQIFVSIDNMVERFDILRMKHKGSKLTGSNVQAQSISFTNASKEEKYSQAIVNLEKIAEYIEDYKAIADEWEDQINKKTAEAL